MGRHGLVAAQNHGQQLPSFRNLAEAESALFGRREALLDKLKQCAQHTATFRFDLTAASLKDLEKWYFELLEHHGFERLGVPRETFEECVSMYTGQVIVHNHPEFRWTVQEFAFQPGKYEIGVTRHLFTWMLTGRADLSARPSNKRRQSLWRDYRRWTGYRAAGGNR